MNRMKTRGLVKYRGVTKVRDKFQMTYPGLDGKYRYGGLYKSAEEAARAHDKWVVELHGAKAMTNESLGLFEGDRARNPYVIEDGIAYLDLPDGQVVLVDAEDYPNISGYYWYTMGRVIVAWDGTRHVNMARLLTGVEEGGIVVHIDGDRYNNRRENLWVTTRSELNRDPDLAWWNS